MTLYEWLRVEQNCIDTYDNVYDAFVTVDYIEDDEYMENPDSENYYKFCVEVVKKVNVVKNSGDGLIVNWNELISNNMEKFRKFSSENWREDCQYKDDDNEFVYQWIKEIHLYLAGYTDEDIYGKMLDLLATIK